MHRVKEWAEKNLQGDPVIWSIVAALALISISVIYSATGALAYRNMESIEHYLFKHAALILLSLAAMFVAHKIDYRYYSRLAKVGLWISVPLLIYAWKAGVNLNDASRWITIPVINQVFQPSDLAKLSLIAGLASMLSKKQQNIADFQKALIPMLIWTGVICSLIAMADLSSAVLLFATSMLLMFIGRVPVRYLAALIVVGALAGFVAMKVGQRGE